MAVKVAVGLLALWLAVAQAYPGGVPCPRNSPPPAGTPSHGSRGRSSRSSPFSVKFKNSYGQQTTCYSPGETIDVVLSGGRFKGFRLESTAGEFAESGYQHPCGSQYKQYLSHSSSSVKNRVTAQWTAPNYAAGTVEIKYVVVQSYSVWYNEQTAKIYSC